MQNKIINQVSPTFIKLVVVVLLLNLPQLSLSQSNNLELPTSINENGSEPHPSAILDINSSKKGVLFPRMKFSEILAIENPAEGLMVFDLEFKCLRLYIDNCWECMYQTQTKKTAPVQFIATLLAQKSHWSDRDFLQLESDDLGNLYALVSDDEESDFYFVKQSKTGTLKWSIRDSGLDEFQSIAIDTQRNLYLAGTLNADSIFVKKFDENGNLIWNTTFDLGGNFFSVPVGIVKIEVNNTGDIFIGGNFNAPFSINNISLSNNGSDDVFLMKLKDNGNSATVDWLQSFGEVSTDFLVDLEIDNFNNIYTIISSYETLIEYQPFYNKMTTKKLASNGTELWSKSINSENGIKAHSFTLSPENEIIFAATVNQSYTIDNGYVVNIEEVGEQVLIGNYSSSGFFAFFEGKYIFSENAYIYDMNISADGSLYITGRALTFYDTCYDKSSFAGFLVKLNYQNTYYNTIDTGVEWVYPFNVNDPQLTITSDNEVFVGGLYKKSTTKENEVIPDPEDTDDYFYILQLVE